MSNAIGFDHRGPTLGRFTLLQKTHSGWTPLASADVAAICRQVFGRDAYNARLDAGLSTVAKALNAGDTALAGLATCLLPLPHATTKEPDLLKASPTTPIIPATPRARRTGKADNFGQRRR